MNKQYTIANIENILLRYLICEARKKLYSNQPITFNYNSQSQSVNDSENHSYRIDSDQLTSFQQYFKDTQYKSIRLHDWHFQTQFQGKICKMITLNAEFIVLIQNKSKTVNIKDCPFRIFIHDEKSLKQCSQEILGYLNRIGKRNLVYQSNNVQKQISNLTSFILQTKKLSFVDRISIIQIQQQQQLDPLKSLNKQGLKILEKISHFISKNDLLQFMKNQELSEEGARKVRRLIIPQKIKVQKKTFSRDVIQEMRKKFQQEDD